jgi:predicted nucleic acid-binding Zn ribbon protein
VIRKFSDPPEEKCPKCGGGVRKLQSAPAFQFKGTGWYVTDYAKSGQPEGKASTEGKKEKDTATETSSKADSSTSGSSTTSSSSSSTPAGSGTTSSKSGE